MPRNKEKIQNQGGRKKIREKETERENASNRPTFKETKMQTKKESHAHTTRRQILDVTSRDGDAQAQSKGHKGGGVCEREAKIELIPENSYLK